MESKHYTLAVKTSVTYGHGSHGEEYHIKPIDGYTGGKKFHPLFKTSEETEEYKDGLKYNSNLFVVELEGKLDADFQLDRLYEWLMDENREPAQTKFTAGALRDVAKEIEFRVKPDEVDMEDVGEVVLISHMNEFDTACDLVGKQFLVYPRCAVCGNRAVNAYSPCCSKECWTKAFEESGPTNKFKEQGE